MTLCTRTDGAWTALLFGMSAVNAEGVQASYDTLRLWSEAEREAFGVFEAAEPDPAPAGKVEASRALVGEDRPRWAVTYRDAPEPAVPDVISDRQFAQVLALDGIISHDEALAWAARGDLPKRMTDALDMIPEDGGQRFGARMMLSAATTYERRHPLVPMLGALLDMDAAALDRIWRTGAAL